MAILTFVNCVHQFSIVCIRFGKACEASSIGKACEASHLFIFRAVGNTYVRKECPVCFHTLLCLEKKDIKEKKESLPCFHGCGIMDLG